jgi:hypothetical protein
MQRKYDIHCRHTAFGATSIYSLTREWAVFYRTYCLKYTDIEFHWDERLGEIFVDCRQPQVGIADYPKHAFLVWIIGKIDFLSFVGSGFV